MKISIQFQYLPPFSERPDDCSDSTEQFRSEDGGYLPFPNVGDTVSYDGCQYDLDHYGRPIPGTGREMTVERKVKTRHFTYLMGWVCVNLVVVDVSDREMGQRLKE